MKLKALRLGRVIQHVRHSLSDGGSPRPGLRRGERGRGIQLNNSTRHPELVSGSKMLKQVQHYSDIDVIHWIATSLRSSQ